MSLRICGFWTSDKYFELAKRMVASVTNLGYQVDLYQMPHAEHGPTAWGSALRYKPIVVERTMQAHPEDNILYLDADCEMKQHPKELLEDETADLAASYIRPRHMYGCTMFFRAGERSWKYVQKWKESYSLRPDIQLDEVHAYFALGSIRRELPGFRVMSLPFSYSWTPRTASSLYPGSTPVILHHAAGTGEDRDKVLREAKLHIP